MSSGDYRVMSVLTEHMGFPPITLIDETINAVNEIMLKALVGLSDYLKRQRNNQLNALNCGPDASEEDQSKLEEEGIVFPLKEIDAGLVSFDTLCHSHLDKNFDKFELYTLRNILTIPRDLVDGGWIRLKHHDYLDLLDHSKLVSKAENKQLLTLVTLINLELHLRKILRLQVANSRAIVDSLTHYKRCIDGLMLTHSNEQLSPEAVKMLRDNLDPISESVYYLLSQVSELVQQVLELNEKILRRPDGKNLVDVQFRPSSREVYIEEKTHMLLERIGLIQENRGSKRDLALG